MSNDNMLRPVFVISPGRSGSTLLQRYLNSSDDLLIWGEHGGFISKLSEAYFKFANNQYVQNLLVWGRGNADLLLSPHTLIEVDIEWTNNFTLDDWRTAYRDLVLRLFTIDVSPSSRWGFKEIRYGEKEIRLLKDLFPQAQFIFLVRHPVDTLASMIAAWSQSEDIWDQESWDNSEQFLEVQEFIAQHCSRTIKVSSGINKYVSEGFLIKYEDLKERPYAILSSVCDFLNVTLPSNEKITMISSDIRKATDTKAIKKALYTYFINNEKVREVCDLYKAFGYSCMVP
jgi:LPS sulfotransferase NodH